MTGPRARLGLGLCALAAVVLHRVRHDYEQRGELSPSTSALGWVLYLSHWTALAAAARRRVWPLPIRKRLARALGAPLAAMGGAMFASGVHAFRSFGQVSGTSNEGLVTQGVYRYSRNPQNVGAWLVLVGVAIGATSGLALLLAGAFLAGTRLYLVIEERHMRRTYGDEWERYARHTPRFLGRARLER